MPQSLTRTARLMSWISMIGAVAIVLGYAILWLDLPSASAVLHTALPGLATPGLGFTQLAMGFALGAIPVVLAALALLQARNFFALYTGDDLFPAAGTETLRSLGRLLFALAISSFVVRTLAALLFSWHLPDGQQILLISFSSSDVFLFVLGGLVMMIGHVLAEASRIARENREFI